MLGLALTLPSFDPFGPLLSYGWSRLKLLISATGIVGVFIAVFAAGPSSASAISVIPPSFSQLVTRASEVVRVEVVDIISKFDGPDSNSTIYTYVRCRVIRALKGEARSEIELRLLGGVVGDSGMEVLGMPKFVRGGKYILFVSGNGVSFCPLVGVMHGQYHVVTDERSEATTERVLQYNNQPLTSLAGIGQPSAEQSIQNSQRPSTSASLSVAEFEQAILSELSTERNGTSRR